MKQKSSQLNTWQHGKIICRLIIASTVYQSLDLNNSCIIIALLIITFFTNRNVSSLHDAQSDMFSNTEQNVCYGFLGETGRKQSRNILAYYPSLLDTLRKPRQSEESELGLEQLLPTYLWTAILLHDTL